MSQPRPLLSPPETEEQLLAQAQQLSGYTLGELAALAGLVTPENLNAIRAGLACYWRSG